MHPINFLVKWVDLITEMFKKYPLPAALMTAAAVGAYFWLETYRGDKKQPVVDAFAVLVGWAIAVPVLGLALDALIKTWNIAAFIYKLYDQHPLFVGVCFLLAVLGYFVWGRFQRAPSGLVRGLILTLAFCILVALGVPLVNAFSPAPHPPPSEKPTSP